MTALLAARAFLSRIPWQVWAAIALVIVIGIGVHKHGKAIDHLKAASYAQGYAKAVEVGKAEAARIEAEQAKIVTELRNRSNEENRLIARNADDLRMRGPGQARCIQPARISRPASGRVAPSGKPDAPATGMPDADWIAVPYSWIIDGAEAADLNRAEVIAWREWHKRMSNASRP